MTAPYNVTAETVQGLVQGEHNTVTLTINNYSSDGALVTPAAGPAPAPRPIPVPVRLLPPPFPDLLGRSAELEAATETLISQRPVEVSGAAGIGKSALLRHLARHPSVDPFASGVVFREYRGEPLSDVVQMLFEAFYESDVKYTDTRIRSFLQDIHALVVLDDAELGREELESLRNTVPGCVLVLASEQPPLLGEGRFIALRGLADSDALALFERRISRTLRPEEREPALVMCRAVQGNPLRLAQAAGLLLQDPQRRLDDLALQLADGTAGLGDEVLRTATAQERAVLEAMAPFRATPLDAGHVARMTGLADAETMLASLANRGLVQANSPSYSVVGPVREALLSGGTPDSETTRTLQYASSLVGGGAAAAWPRPDEVDLVVAASGIAASSGRWLEALRLARSVEGVLAAANRWGAWESTLHLALRAAEETSDIAAEGWARHQLGTRALCLENYGVAGEELHRALLLREAVNDPGGAAATRANLETLDRFAPGISDREKIDRHEQPRPPEPTPGFLWAVAVAVVIVVVAVLVLSRGGGDQQPSGGGTSPSTVTVAPPTRLLLRSVDPPLLTAGTVRTPLAVLGEGFSAGVRVDVAGGDIEVTVRRVTERRLEALATVSADAEPGRRDVRVTNIGGATAMCRACLIVRIKPAVTAIRPSDLDRSTKNVVVTLIGTGFMSTPSVTVEGGGVTVNSVSLSSAGLLRAEFSVDRSAAIGARDVAVTNPDGGSATCSGCLTITTGLTVASVDPVVVQQGTRRVLTVIGTGFRGTPVVGLGAGMDVRGVTRKSASELTVVVAVSSDAPIGVRNVTVTNADGASAACEQCLEVKPVIVD